MRFIIFMYVLLVLFNVYAMSWACLKSKTDLTLARLVVYLLVGVTPIIGIIAAITSLMYQRLYRGNRTVFDTVIVKA